MNNTKNSTSAYAWLIWILASCMFLFEYFPRVAPAVMADQIMHHFNADTIALGSLSSFFYIGYITMQIPAGILVDRFSTRFLLGGSTLICGLSALAFAYSDLIVQAEVARFITGVTAAFGFVGALKIAKLWFPPEKIGFLSGGTQALGMLGAAIGEGQIAAVSEKLGWHTTMLWISGIVILLGVALLLIVRDKKQTVAQQHSPILQSLIIVLKNPLSWLNALIAGTLYAPIAAFGELWGPSYIHKIYNLPLTTSAGAVSFIFIGWAIGSPIAGAISDKIGRRRPVIIASAALSFVFLCAVLYLPNLSTTMLYILLFLFGISNVGVAINYAVAIEINSAQVAGTSVAFANMASILIGAALQPIIGALLVHGKNASGSQLYSAADFHSAMLVLPACSGICFLASLLLPETFPKK
jgi:sugar phosphate permease